MLVFPRIVYQQSTLECLYRNVEALPNEPRQIMQAASSDPRMMTVKSRHGKAQLLVKALKNGSLFECNCTIYKSLGVHQDTIAVANNLYIHTCIRAYVHTCIRAYVHTYIRTYVRTYIRTYIHTYIHTYATHATHARAHAHAHTHIMNDYVNIKMNWEEK